jgi:hypothetical protein
MARETSHDRAANCEIKKDVLRCRKAAQSVTVNESFVRGDRDFSNQAFSPCYLCGHFAASAAIIAFSGGLSPPIQGCLGGHQAGYDLVEDPER